MKKLVAISFLAATAATAATAQAPTDEDALSWGRQTVAFLECSGLTLDMAKVEAFEEKGLTAGRAYLTYAEQKGHYPRGLPLHMSMVLDTLTGPTIDFRLGQLQMLLTASLSHEEPNAIKVDWKTKATALYEQKNCDLLLK